MKCQSHLELLREMFPEKFVLDIAEVAKVLGCSKQWIYVQSSRNALPFAKLPGSRIRVTVMELARCRIPDDCIDKNRYPLFMARSVLRELIESLPSTRSL